MNIDEILMKVKDEYGIEANEKELGGMVLIIKHESPENEFTVTHIEAFENQAGSFDFNIKKETQYLSEEQVALKKASESQAMFENGVVDINDNSE